MNERTTQTTRRTTRTTALFAMAGFLAIALVLTIAGSTARASDPPLAVRVIAGYNLVVDSNVSSPSTYAPRVATVIGEFCNTGSTDLTNVYGYIGNGTTPGTYPVYDSDTQTTYPYLNNSGDYFYRHVGPAGDASRFMGTIPVGQCRYQYWTIEYPACENVGGSWHEPPCTGDPLWGPSIKPDDDFSLQFVIWGVSDQTTTSANWTMTMRNEISAMANKIEPNPNGRWFNTESDTVRVGDVITTNGILYSLGVTAHPNSLSLDLSKSYNSGNCSAWRRDVTLYAEESICQRILGTD